MKTKMLILTMGVALAACAADDVYDDSETDDIGGKADRAATPAGRYVMEGSDFQAGMFTELTLNADRTFGGHAFTYCGAPGAAEFVRCGQYRGSYKLTKSTTTTNRYIRFYDEDGDFVGRFQYTLAGGKLRMKPTAGSWTTLDALAAATFIADAKDAFLNATEDELVALERDDLPPAARTALDQAGSRARAVRFQVDGMSAYAVTLTLTDASWAHLFDETGAIASGSSDFAGHWHWDVE